MGVLQGKLVTRTLILLVVGLVFFGSILTEAMAQQGTTPASPTQATPASTAAPNTTSTQTAPTSPVPDDDYGIGTVAESLKLDGLNYWLFVIIAGIGSLIAWLGGILFDLSLSAFTVNMASMVTELQLDTAIAEMWTIIRDIFNLLFIFGLIYAGFRIILDANDSSSKKTIGTIIIAALIINFSLYFTQVVVDFSNIAAYEIHQMIVGDNPSKKHFGPIPIPSTSSQFYLLSGLNEQRSGGGDSIKNEIGAVAGGKEPSDSSSPLGAIALGFIFLIFYSVLGFVFIACAVMLFTRFFALIFWMIFSPILLLGLVLPKMQSQSDKWMQQFFNQALVGPVLVFMIYLSLRALQGLGGSGREPGLMATIIYLMVVIAFLAASLKVAKSLGAYGADRAMSIGQNITKSIRGGVQGYAGRWTVGAGSNWAQKKFTSWQAKPDGDQSRAGRFLRRGLNATGVERSIMGITDKGRKTKFGSSRSWEDTDKYVKDRDKRIAKGQASQQFESRIKSGATAGQNTAERRAFEQSMRDATTNQLVAQLDEYKPGSSEYRAIVETMSASQFDDVMKTKDEDFSDAQKNQLRDARALAVRTQLTSGGATLGSAIGTADASQLRALDFQTIMANISNLRPSQIDEIKKSDRYPTPQKQQIVQTWEQAMINRYSQPNQIRNLKPEEAAKLPKAVFTNRNPNGQLHITPGLTISILSELKKNLNAGEYTAIWDEIVTTTRQQSRNTAVRDWIMTPQNQAQQGANLHP